MVPHENGLRYLSNLFSNPTNNFEPHTAPTACIATTKTTSHGPLDGYDD